MKNNFNFRNFWKTLSSKNVPNFWQLSIKQSYKVSKNPLRMFFGCKNLLNFTCLTMKSGIPQLSSHYCRWIYRTLQPSDKGLQRPDIMMSLPYYYRDFRELWYYNINVRTKCLGIIYSGIQFFFTIPYIILETVLTKLSSKDEEYQVYSRVKNDRYPFDIPKHYVNRVTLREQKPS